VGLAIAGVLWVARLGPLNSDERYQWANYRLQWLWASALRSGAFTIFAIRPTVHVDALPGDVPVLLLMRHASVADTILAACYLSKPHSLRLRYVLKRELLWDPCLDVVGHRVPNHFVDRGSDEPQREQEAVAQLAAGVGAGEGVLIYPEGTRYSAARRARIIESARTSGNTELETRASQLVGVLPPRPGGTLALLKAMPQAQVMVGNHRGLEVAKSFTDLVNGALIGADVVAEFRCVDRPAAGSGDAQCRDWLDRLWINVDRFATEKS
jgi:1-acyl-sn-glycerol-3-phosphate acyltransferase